MPAKGSGGFCSVPGCNRPHKGRGLCLNHYQLSRKYGRTEKLPRGTKRSHPLYSLWFDRKTNGVLCAEWLDFWKFVEGVGDKPGPNYFLIRKGSQPFGPDNFIWIEHLKKRPDETKKEWYARKWASRMLNNPGIERKRMLQRKYNMTAAAYDAMAAQQNNKCAICEEPESSFDQKCGSRKRLCVDHCHSTGKIRGLLCLRCNTTLGKLEESPQLLRAMWDYLHEHAKVEAA